MRRFPAKTANLSTLQTLRHYWVSAICDAVVLDQHPKNLPRLSASCLAAVQDSAPSAPSQHSGFPGADIIQLTIDFHMERYRVFAPANLRICERCNGQVFCMPLTSPPAHLRQGDSGLATPSPAAACVKPSRTVRKIVLLLSGG
jgi:hypothetical protein